MDVTPLSAALGARHAWDARGLDSVDAVLVLESASARKRFLERAGGTLAAGEAIVRACDLVGRRRMMLVTPDDPRAQLVAREEPTVLPGGLTALVSYYRAPLDARDATEHHFEEGERIAQYVTRLRIERQGRPEHTARTCA